MDKTDEKLRIYTFIILIFILIALISKFFLGESDSSLLPFILAIVILMVLLLKISDLKSFNLFGSNFKADFQEQLDQTNKQVEETKAKVKETGIKIDETRDRVEKLFLATMASPMYYNLRKLANPPFGKYVLQSALKRELYHLRDIGYISISLKCEGSISEIPPEGEDLSIYVTITESGKEFIEEREKIAK